MVSMQDKEAVEAVAMVAASWKYEQEEDRVG